MSRAEYRSTARRSRPIFAPNPRRWTTMSSRMLVAPLRIGAGATIGAGSTITEDAPAEQLTLGRARQVSIPGWKRPQKEPKKKS